MHKTRNRLLILLAFLTVASVSVWVEAGATPRQGIVDDSPGAPNPSVTNPGVTPSTGEPDGSGGPGIVPPPPKFGLGPGDGSAAAPAPWLRSLEWAGRIWAARVFGVWLR
jgi:hypothetical protein